MSMIEVKVPHIGDFESVEIIEVLVAPGDDVQIESSLITVESDKASMEIPSPVAGKVKSIAVRVGDKIAEGRVILLLDTSAVVEDKAEAKAASKLDSKTGSIESAEQVSSVKAVALSNETSAANFSGTADMSAEIVVLGSGPGGYTAAFRAADLGKKVILIEKDPGLGGVCLNVGCIPSKALLHVAEVMEEAHDFSALGVEFNKPKIDAGKLREHKNKIVGKLTGGLKALAKQRKVEVVFGYGRFTSPHTIEVDADGKKQIVQFENCIIAAGSSVMKLPFVPWEDPRVWDSTDALELHQIPKRMLIVGGGIIGLEMATVYHALGAKITVVELSPGLIPGADRDLIRPFEKILKGRYENIFLNTKVSEIKPTASGVVCKFETPADDKSTPKEDTFDAVLVAIGRTPNGKLIDADKAGVAVDERGFIAVDKQQRTNVNHIFAIRCATDCD